jgi:hypothetical protein
MPPTPGVYLDLIADDTCIYVTHCKEGYGLRKLPWGLSAIEMWCECWNIKIDEDKTQAIHFSHRFTPPEAHLTLNGRNIPFVNQVKYLSVIFDKRITWRLHIEMIESKPFRTFIRIYSLLKRECLSANIKVTLHKALIRSVMAYACPSCELAADTCLKNCSAYKIRFSTSLEIIQGAHRSPICTWFSFRMYTITACNKIVRVTSWSHTKSWGRACSRYRTRRSQTEKI